MTFTLRQHAFAALLGVVTALASGFGMFYLWDEWTILALVAATFYFIGGLRFMPWETRLRKVFSTAVFIGLSVATIVWLKRNSLL